MKKQKKPDSNKKNKGLEEAIAEITQRFGEGAIMKLKETS